MKKKIFYLLMIIGLMTVGPLYGQNNPTVGILPMQYNPSFAGSAGNSRLVTYFSYQQLKYSDRSDHYRGLSFSYDNFIPKIRSGIGFTADGFGGNLSNAQNNFDRHDGSLSIIIAPKISVKGKYTLSPSFQISYSDIYREFDWDSKQYSFNGVSGNVGFLFNTPRYYIGYALRVFKSDGLKSIYNDKLYSAIQFGYSFRKNEDSRFSFTPQLVLPLIFGFEYNAYNFDYLLNLNYALNFRYDNFVLGALSNFGYWYPTGFQTGWQNKDWRLMLTNQFKNEYNKRWSGFEAGLSLRYVFNQDKNSKFILY